MTIFDLQKIKDCIVVITGKYASTYIDNCLSYHPEAEEGEDNRPRSVIRRIEKMCKTRCKGIVITQSPFVIESFELFGRKFNCPVRFFIWGDEKEPEGIEIEDDPETDKVIEVTDNTAKIYNITCDGLGYLETERYMQNNGVFDYDPDTI